VFEKIRIDTRVTPGLLVCLLCVNHEGPTRHVSLVRLTDVAKQCPRCRRVYLLPAPPGEVQAPKTVASAPGERATTDP
jgi:hypothetical protein